MRLKRILLIIISSLAFTAPLQAVGMSCSTYLSISPDVPYNTLSNDDVLDILDSAKPGDLRIEIGAAKKPLCQNCVQVDQYTSSFDIYKTRVDALHREFKNSEILPDWVVKETGGDHLTIEQQIQRWSALTGDPVEVILEPFAVVKQNGIVASANNLPFKNQTVDLIIKKNFPWFITNDLSSSEKMHYRSFLVEYQRVLKVDGQAILLINGMKNPLVKMKFHIEEAKKLGFRITTTKGEYFSGIVITKTGGPDQG